MGGLRQSTIERNKMCKNSSFLLSSSANVETIPSLGEPNLKYCPKAYCILKSLFCKYFTSNYPTTRKNNTLGCNFLRIIVWEDWQIFMLSKNKRGF